MAWLWLVSVGVSDVQFPAWKQDEYGQWSKLCRFEMGRGGCRAAHERLLTLMAKDRIVFPEGPLPQALWREEARDLRFELEVVDEDTGEFIAALRPVDQRHQAGYWVSSHGDVIPNQYEARLPLYCPKVAELLSLTEPTFGQGPLSLVVLNTRRDQPLPDGRDEPIASGPLVAKFLAERLNLVWRDGGGVIPDALEPGVATWVDILTGNEAMEDPVAQARVVRRITDLIKAWQPAGERRIAVTTAGGMPPLKPIIERVPATCLGQAAVRLLDRPERGTGGSHSSRLPRPCGRAGDLALPLRRVGAPWRLCQWPMVWRTGRRHSLGRVRSAIDWGLCWNSRGRPCGSAIGICTCPRSPPAGSRSAYALGMRLGS
jgi:hypothetical protein